MFHHSRVLTFTALAVSLALATESSLWAQRGGAPQTVPGQAPSRQAQQQASQQQRQQQQGQQRLMLTDSQVAGLLIGQNQAEVQLSQLAIERAQNQQVKQFAQEMVQEHTQVIQKLHQVALGVDVQNDQQQAGRTQQQQQPGQRRGQGLQAAAQQNAQLIRLSQQLTNRYVELAKQELQSYPQSQFDEAYIGQQVLAHLQMLAALEVLQQHASQDLKPLLQQTETATGKHLQMARQLMQQITQTPAAAQRPATTERQ